MSEPTTETTVTICKCKTHISEWALTDKRAGHKPFDAWERGYQGAMDDLIEALKSIHCECEQANSGR